MPIKTPKELFVMLLTDVRQGAERAEKIYEEIGQLVQEPQIKEALQARAFVSGKVLATLDECFRLLGEQPARLTGRLHETLIEDFRKELAEIQGPVAKRIRSSRSDGASWSQSATRNLPCRQTGVCGTHTTLPQRIG